MDVFNPAAGRELIRVGVGGQDYCVAVASVREIRGWTAATPIPGAPDYIRGVINLRGLVLPILDLRVRLGLPPAEPGARSAVVVCEIHGRTIGLLVDAVSDILTVTSEQLQPTPDIARAGEDLVDGVLAMDGWMAGLLRLERVVPDMEIAAAA